MSTTETHTGKTQNHPYPLSFSKEMIVLDHGEGVYVEDIAGNRYLDFGSGIAVNALGYGRKDLAETASEQMKRLIHVSNLYATEPSIRLGKRLIALGDFSAVHFGNSGSEANESAIKFARNYSLNRKGEGHHKLHCFTNAFHGRTLGALSCTPTEKYQKPFEPLVPGVTVGDFNDIDALRSIIDDTYACVLTEVVQGEGGLDTMTPEFSAELNTLCKRYDILLIADEVQTGLGRCGYPFAGRAVGLEPDIITLAKPLAGGLPLSATLIPERVNNELHLGMHGTTFGGGPVTTAVAEKVVDILLDESFLNDLRKKAQYLHEALQGICDDNPGVTRVKGLGFLKGLELSKADAIPEILTALQEKGMLVLRSGSSMLRIAPPLVISREDLERGIDLITTVCSEIL